MESPSELLALNLKRLRESRRWTQPKLAEEADLSVQMVQKLEYGQTNPSNETLARLAGAFKCAVADLYGGVVPPLATTIHLSPDELVDRLTKVISINAVPGELAAAWRGAEEWQRYAALFLLTLEEQYLDRAPLPEKLKTALQTGLRFHKSKHGPSVPKR